MCGRYGLTIDQEATAVAFGVDSFLIDHHARYNIAPSQPVPALVDGRHGRRVVGLRWGLVPSWADDPRIGFKTINARSESVASRPSFRDAWARPRRCVLLADGFYEWASAENGGAKRPHWITMADGRPFGFAGLWESWRPRGRGSVGDDDPLLTCTILTTEANDLLAPIHPRMPVILGDAEAWNAWADPAIPSEELRGYLAPFDPNAMGARPVGTFVNNANHEGPECLSPG